MNVNKRGRVLSDLQHENQQRKMIFNQHNTEPWSDSKVGRFMDVCARDTVLVMEEQQIFGVQHQFAWLL